MEEAVLKLRAPVGARGSPKLLPQLSKRLKEPGQRKRLLDLLRLLESEPSILGMSRNFVAVGRGTRRTLNPTLSAPQRHQEALTGPSVLTRASTFGAGDGNRTRTVSLGTVQDRWTDPWGRRSAWHRAAWSGLR